MPTTGAAAGIRGTRPKSVDQRLADLDRRFERLERRLEGVLELAEQAPAVIGTTADIVDEWAKKKGDVDERVRRMASLLEKLSEPRTLATLEQGLELAVSAPDVIATVADISDEAMRDAADAGVDIGQLGHALQALALDAGRIVTTPALADVVHEAADSPQLWALLGQASQAMLKAASRPEQVGVFGLWRALRDPDVQRGVGFFIQFARLFGKQLARVSPSELGAGK